MATMKAAFVRQGKEGIVKARAVEDRLMRDTWQMDSYAGGIVRPRQATHWPGEIPRFPRTGG